MRIHSLIQLAFGISLVGGCSIAACSASGGGTVFGDAGGAGGTGDPGGTSNNGTGGGVIFTTSTGSGTGGGPLMQEPDCSGVDPSLDSDGDGWTGAAGDCNDCTAQMNPGAQDYPGNNIDEDCNTAKDDNPTNCDGALNLDSPDPLDGARAMGLCKIAQGQGWGVLSAAYVTSDGQPLANYDPAGLGHGIMSNFGTGGVNPQEGVKLLGLSSGTARQPTDIGYMPVSGYDKFYSTGAPAGYPKESPSCPGVLTGPPFDSAALSLQIRTPTNAQSLSFNLNFYTYEFPAWICSEYNDFFVAILKPSSGDGNISFDTMGNTLSVNAGFLQVCQPQMAGGKNFPCPLGTGQLAGTGYEPSAATGWLQTTAPVPDPGAEITLLFAIWDSGDGILDSTILLDNFAFSITPADTETVPVETPK